MTRKRPAAGDWSGPERWRTILRPVREICAAAGILLLGMNGLAGADVTLNKTVYRPVKDIAEEFGMSSSGLMDFRTVRMQNKYCTLEFTADSRSLKLNGQPMSLGAPVLKSGGSLYITKLDYTKNLLPLLAPQSLTALAPLRRIVLDAGHGGTDPGAQNPWLKIKEKTMTLDTVQRLAAILKKRGYEVTLTRPSDDFVKLTDRTELANKAKGDLFISIHFNEAADPSVSGFETYILSPAGQPSGNNREVSASEAVARPGNKFDAWNAIAGFSVEKAVAKALGANNRGLKRARWDVLTGLQMPGMLVECGFVSSPEEGAKILSPSYRDKLALGIADGVELYKATLNSVRDAQPKPKASPAPAPKSGK